MVMPNWFDPQSSLLILPPVQGKVPSGFRLVETDPHRHALLLAEAQRFRARAYLDAGYVQPSELTADGRHALDVDRTSWHLLAVSRGGRISGCARCLVHDDAVVLQRLWVRDAAVIRSPKWGPGLRAAIERDLELVRQRQSRYVEVGGWAIAKERRGTTDALRIALGTYGLGLALGAGIAVTTAAVKHGSSSILRRIGGRPVEVDGVELPPYYDPQYRCELEMLRFDCRFPSERYLDWIEAFRIRVPYFQVVSGRARSV